MIVNDPRDLLSWCKWKATQPDLLEEDVLFIKAVKDCATQVGSFRDLIRNQKAQIENLTKLPDSYYKAFYYTMLREAQVPESVGLAQYVKGLKEEVARLQQVCSVAYRTLRDLPADGTDDAGFAKAIGKLDDATITWTCGCGAITPDRDPMFGITYAICPSCHAARA